MPQKDPYEGIKENPNKAGSFDIVLNYDWTSVPRGRKLREEAPSAYITAYELKYTQLSQFIDGYMNLFSPRNSFSEYGDSNNPGLDFYKGLYSVAKTPLARFNFPFFSDNMRSFSNEFSDSFSQVSQRGAQMLFGSEIMGLGEAGESLGGGGAALAKGVGDINIGSTSLADKVGKLGTGLAKKVGMDMDFSSLNAGKQTIGAPGTFIETPKFYQYSNTDNGVQIGFTLSNTLEDDGFDKNYDFITKFIRLNRPFRRGPIGMNFPAIYNLVVPGVRYIQWAALEDFNVGLLGSRRKVYKEGAGDIIIPEAYTCEFSFKSLTLEPANFVDEISKFPDGFNGYRDNRSAVEKEFFSRKKKIEAEEKKIQEQNQQTSIGGTDSIPQVPRAQAQANVDALENELENLPTLK